MKPGTPAVKSKQIKVEGEILDAHAHAIDCAAAWAINTGAMIGYQDGLWHVVETDADPEIFDDVELIEEYSGQSVEVVA